MAYARCNAAESAARMAGRARGFLIRLRGQGAGGGGGGPWCEEDWAFLMSARGCSARGEGEWREKGCCAGDAEGEFYRLSISEQRNTLNKLLQRAEIPHSPHQKKKKENKWVK